jgi:hypothetical protein
MGSGRTVSKPLIALMLAGVLLIGGAGGGMMIWRGMTSSEPVGENDAVTTFREADSGVSGVEGAPAPGVYTYRVVGSEAGGFAGLKASRDFPERAQYTVWQREGGWETRLDLSKEHVEYYDYGITAEGVSVNRIRTVLTLLGQTSDVDTEIAPALPWVPADAAPGDTWESGYTDSEGTSVSYANQVLRREAVSVAGAEIDTLVVERRSTLSGPTSGEWVDTHWWSVELGLPVRFTATGESSQGGGTFSQDAALTLASTEPLR